MKEYTFEMNGTKGKVVVNANGVIEDCTFVNMKSRPYVQFEKFVKESGGEIGPVNVAPVQPPVEKPEAPTSVAKTEEKPAETPAPAPSATPPAKPQAAPKK